MNNSITKIKLAIL